MIRRDVGFTLIEMMISLVIGLVLVSGIGSLFVSTNKSYIMQHQLIRMQENARVALDFLSSSIRVSSFTGCPHWSAMGNSIFTSEQSKLWMAHFDKGILGIPSGTSVTSSIDSNATSEAIVVHYLDWEQRKSVLAHDSTAAKITFASSHGFDRGDLMALVDGSCAQLSAFIAGAGTVNSIVTYPAIAANSLRNCSTIQRGLFNCMEGEVGSGSFDHSSSQLIPVLSMAYYIRSSDGVPTLYRKRGGHTISGSEHSPSPLVDGIESIRVLYGYDSDDDGVVNQYLTSSQIDPYSKDWRNVISVNIEILVRSLLEVLSSPKSYFFAGTNITPVDKFIRKVFIATVKLRNRSS